MRPAANPVCETADGNQGSFHIPCDYGELFTVRLLKSLAAMLAAWPITPDPIFSSLTWALIFGITVSTWTIGDSALMQLLKSNHIKVNAKNMAKNILYKFLFLVALTLFGLFASLPSFYKNAPEWLKHVCPTSGMQLGLDLQGGMQLILTLRCNGV